MEINATTKTKPQGRNDVLETISNLVSKMEKTHHIEILDIICRYPAIPLHSKMDGFRFRFDMFPPEAIEEIRKYVEYVCQQESALNLIEREKCEIKREYFTE